MPKTASQVPPSEDQATEPYSILLMAFGQSNADVHDAGPRLLPSPGDTDPVVAPNDGAGIRGLMGRDRARPITGFVPAAEVEPKIQSLLAAAGTRLYRDRADAGLARVIVRSEAKGGRRFLGFMQGDREIEGIFLNHDGARSQVIKNLVQTLHECVEAAKGDGPPVRKITILWLHGESDRALSRQEYSDLFEQFLDAAENGVSDVALPIEWLITQSSGTSIGGGGNCWPNRLAIFDVADRRDNVHVVAAGYGYQMGDTSHFSAHGKLGLGETLGRIVGLRDADIPHRLPRLQAATLRDDRILLTFDTLDPLVIDRETFPPPGPFDGFEARDRRGATLSGVAVTGPDTVELTMSQSPDINTLECCYAYHRNATGNTPVQTDYPVGRGGLRTANGTPSKLVPGAMLHNWAAGFAITGKDMTHDQ